MNMHAGMLTGEQASRQRNLAGYVQHPHKADRKYIYNAVIWLEFMKNKYKQKQLELGI